MRWWSRGGIIVPTFVLLLLFVVPLAFIVEQSLRESLTFGQISDYLTLDTYRTFFADPFYRAILVRTILIGLMVTVLALVIGFPVAQAINRSEGLRRIIMQAVIFVPLLTSAVVRTFGWMLVLADSGFVNTLLINTGLRDEPFKIMFTPIGVVVGMTHVLLPFMILTLASTLRQVEGTAQEASATLGASPAVTFREITLPMALPGIIAGSTLVFSLTVSSFVTPALLGGLRSQMMATLAYDSAINDVNWPFASVVSLVMLVITLAFISVYYRWAQ
jgi:putative spermidine/putrescine transport system permease protein